MEKARTEYRSLAEKWPAGPFAKTAAGRAKALDELNTKQFYDWLAKYEPPKPLSREPGTPGVRPDFLQEPDAGTLNLPATLDETPTFPSFATEPSSEDKPAAEPAADDKPATEPAPPSEEKPAADEPPAEAAPQQN